MPEIAQGRPMPATVLAAEARLHGPCRRFEPQARSIHAGLAALSALKRARLRTAGPPCLAGAPA